MLTAIRNVVLALAAATTLAGCDYLPFGYTPIREILAAPARFEGKEVKIHGNVRIVLKLLDIRAYTVRDDTGEITVVTNGPVPAEKSRVALRGTVRSPLIVGGAAVGLHVEETRRLP
jgi:hypothetical protein